MSLSFEKYWSQASIKLVSTGRGNLKGNRNEIMGKQGWKNELNDYESKGDFASLQSSWNHHQRELDQIDSASNPRGFKTNFSQPCMGKGSAPAKSANLVFFLLTWFWRFVFEFELCFCSSTSIWVCMFSFSVRDSETPMDEIERHVLSLCFPGHSWQLHDWHRRSTWITRFW